jgi:hypothetical protein
MKRFIAALALALAACASAPIDTTAKRIAAAHETIDALANTAYTLRLQGALTADQKNKVADRLREAETALDSIASIQDPTAANNQLALVIAALTAIQAELAAHGK